MAPSGARARKAARALREGTVERLGDGRTAPEIPLRDAVLPPMPAPLLGELLGKSKMGARLAANLAMGSTPKSKAGARVAAELALALGDGAAVATVPPPAREAASTMGGGSGGFSCVSCGAEDASAFSKRMLNKRGRHGDRVRRCRACVEAALAAEQREAERRRAAPEGSRERSIRGGAHLECASCLQRLPAAAFSAIELDADDGDATCLRCEGAPVGLYDGDIRGGENAWLAERQQKRRPPA